MRYHKRILLIATIFLSCIGCDQSPKAAAGKYLASSQPLSFLGDIFRLQYIENHGVFLGIGAASSADLRFWLLVVLTGFVLTGTFIFILIRPTCRPSIVVSISLIVSGGVGNLIDRTLNSGAVIDFMNIGVANLRTGILNFADVAIMAGFGCLVLTTVGTSKRTACSN